MATEYLGPDIRYVATCGDCLTLDEIERQRNEMDQRGTMEGLAKVERERANERSKYDTINKDFEDATKWRSPSVLLATPIEDLKLSLNAFGISATVMDACLNGHGDHMMLVQELQEPERGARRSGPIATNHMMTVRMIDNLVPGGVGFSQSGLADMRRWHRLGLLHAYVNHL